MTISDLLEVLTKAGDELLVEIQNTKRINTMDMFKTIYHAGEIKMPFPEKELEEFINNLIK